MEVDSLKTNKSEEHEPNDPIGEEIRRSARNWCRVMEAAKNGDDFPQLEL